MKIRRRILLTITIVLAGWTKAISAQPVDSVFISSPAPGDEIDLEEVVVKSERPRNVISVDKEGALMLDGNLSAEQPSLMGSGDAVAVLRTLPSVVTNNDLQAAMIVRGGMPGSTLFESDGMRIINPMHLLGLYSAFNPAFYSTYRFRDGRIPAISPNQGGSMIEAFSIENPDTCLRGTASLGLVESHGAIHIPLKKGVSSISAGIRQSYINLLFPDILKLGESRLSYNFTDVNLGFLTRIGENDKLRISLFGNRDGMVLHSAKDGEKDGRFGWRNFAAGAEWQHKTIQATLSFTNLSNRFEMTQGGKEISLPSYFSQAAAQGIWHYNDFTFETDAVYRQSNIQRNALLMKESETVRAFEWNLAAQWNKTFFSKFHITAGLRAAYFHNGSYNSVFPMPRVDLSYDLPESFKLFISYGRNVQFDRQIMESNAGLPTDFWISADKIIKPLDVNTVEGGLTGQIPGVYINFTIAGYYKLLKNTGEFTGTILDFTGAGYNPIDDYILGDGYAAGVSVSLSRQIGKIRGRVGYNYGVSRARFDKYGDLYIPTSFDRPHDLNITLSYSPISPLTLAANYVYATGTPYTRAKYGYMLGENLIIEYFSHNSSRLPVYKRLDFSATWTFKGRGKTRHLLNLSIYNLLANKNVLFIYTTYSLNNGVEQKKSVMKAVIPSLSYTFEF